MRFFFFFSQTQTLEPFAPAKTFLVHIDPPLSKIRDWSRSLKLIVLRNRCSQQNDFHSIRAAQSRHSNKHFKPLDEMRIGFKHYEPHTLHLRPLKLFFQETASLIFRAAKLFHQKIRALNLRIHIGG